MWATHPSIPAANDRKQKSTPRGAFFHVRRRSAGFFQVPAQPVDDALFQPGYVGLGDAQVVGHLLLGVLLGRPQPEAQHHDGPLPGGEAVHSAAEHSALGLPPCRCAWMP